MTSANAQLPPVTNNSVEVENIISPTPNITSNNIGTAKNLLYETSNNTPSDKSTKDYNDISDLVDYKNKACSRSRSEFWWHYKHNKLVS